MSRVGRFQKTKPNILSNMQIPHLKDIGSPNSSFINLLNDLEQKTKDDISIHQKNPQYQTVKEPVKKPQALQPVHFNFKDLKLKKNVKIDMRLNYLYQRTPKEGNSPQLSPA